MRLFSMMFAGIALAILAMFVIYVVRGPVDPFIAGGLLVSFFACAAPALYLLKPFESREDFLRRKERLRAERTRRREASGETRDRGS
jgi:hypothetical protein